MSKPKRKKPTLLETRVGFLVHSKGTEMQEEHTPKAALLASALPPLHHSRGMDQLDLAIDLTRVIGLALRAEDYRTETISRSLATVCEATGGLLTEAYKILFDEDYDRRRASGGGDAE